MTHNTCDTPAHTHQLDQAYDLLVNALYAGFVDVEIIGATPQERLMAIALHYGDVLHSQKDDLCCAYHRIIRAPHYWPISHIGSMAERWQQAMELSTRRGLCYVRCTAGLLYIAHSIVQAWWKTSNEEEWMHEIDQTIRKLWFLIEL